MILSRNWLTKYLNLEKINNEQIGAALNSLGFEVEQMIDYQEMNDDLVIGYVEESTLIENTHLNLTKVNIGTKKLTIICGADNVKANQFVVVAQVGQTIANGLTLEAKKIHGYQSQGMICALNEIGFSNQVLTPIEADSIYVLESPSDLHPLIGHSIKEVGFGDYLWDVDLTLNRSDALGAFQLVKELANFFDLKIQSHPFYQNYLNQNETDSEAFKVVVDSEIKPVLQSMVGQSLTIKPSAKKLHATEDLLLKTLQVVSTGDWVEDLAMISSWETGQPLIVFDQDKIRESLKLTWAEVEGKKVVVLKDGHQIVQVLGLPTNLSYQVSPQTKQVFVLALKFDAPVMRHQQKELAISSLALQRYMKPLSNQLYLDGFNAFNHWLKKYQVFESSEMKIMKAPKLPELNFTISLSQIQNLLGIELSVSEIKSLFRTLDFKVQSQGENLTFKVDSHRTDLVGANDLCEEIARLYGYDNIPPVPPTLLVNPAQQNLKLQLQDKLSNYLVGLGFKNTKTYSLINHQQAETWNLFKLKKPIQLASPLSQLHETYRLSLVGSLVEIAAYNSANDNKQFKLWEIADVYTQNSRQRHLALLTTGRLISEPIIHQVLENNYFYLKGIVEAIFNLYKINLSDLSFEVAKKPVAGIHPFINAEIKFKHQIVGFIFRFNPKFENQQKLSSTCYAELNLDLIGELMNRKYEIHPVSKFQSSTRDISLIVPSTLEYEKLIAHLLKNVDHVIDAKIVDQYQDETMKKDEVQSLTISFTFNDLTKQMTEAEISHQWNQVLKNVQKLGLVIR